AECAFCDRGGITVLRVKPRQIIEDLLRYCSTSRKFLAGGLGFEPRFSESESDVLPLNYPPIILLFQCVILYFLQCRSGTGAVRWAADIATKIAASYCACCDRHAASGASRRRQIGGPFNSGRCCGGKRGSCELPRLLPVVSCAGTGPNCRWSPLLS